MKTGWIWTAAAMTSLSSAGCLSTNQWRAIDACQENQASTSCRFYREAVEDEKEAEAYSDWLDEDSQGQYRCSATGGIWHPGRQNPGGLPQPGFCEVLAPPNPIGVSDSFTLMLGDAARPSAWPAEALDTQLRGAFCEVVAPRDLRRALAIVGRGENLGGQAPFVVVTYPSGTNLTYDVAAHEGGGWVLQVREHGELNEGDGVIERVVPGEKGLRVTLRGGEERVYGPCTRDVYAGAVGRW
jgi:hypothetical protein